MACPNGRETAPEGRKAMIADLEELGFDLFPGAVNDWRESMSDDRLKAALAEHDEGSADLPDISEMAEAIREAVKAADAYHAAHPDDDLIPGEAATRWKAAFDRLRALDTQIQKGLEANF